MANAYTSPNVTASGGTWAQLQTRGLAGHLAALLAAQAATADPTVAATLSVTGTGGTLPTGTYTVKVSETNGIGETLPLAAATTQAVTLGDNLVVTFATLKSGNTARNVYIAIGSNALTLVGRGITASTLTISAPLPADSSAVAPPAANTTALSTKQIELIRAAYNGDLRRAYQHAADMIRDFLRGDPTNHASTLKHLRESHVAVALLNTTMQEIGTLLVANPGTLGNSAVIGNTFPKPQRTWP